MPIRVMVIHPPGTVDCVHINDGEGGFDQGMAAIDAGIKDADDGRIEVRLGDPFRQILDPLGLLRTRLIDKECRTVADTP